MKSICMDAPSRTAGQIEAVNLSREEAAQLIGVSVRTLDQMIKQNTIPSFKIGGRRFLNRDAVLAWNTKRVEQAAAQLVEVN